LPGLNAAFTQDDRLAAGRDDGIEAAQAGPGPLDAAQDRSQLGGFLLGGGLERAAAQGGVHLFEIAPGRVQVLEQPAGAKLAPADEARRHLPALNNI
jgi:hypothetical protein